MEKATLQIKNYDKICTMQEDHSDLTVRDWCQMFRAALIGITFHPSQIAQGFKEYAEELEEEEEVWYNKSK